MPTKELQIFIALLWGGIVAVNLIARKVTTVRAEFCGVVTLGVLVIAALVVIQGPAPVPAQILTYLK
jgi:hypothetical protein